MSPPPELGEYFEEDSDEAENNELESISNASFSEDLLVGEEYEDVSSTSSWESSALVCQSELEERECPSTPPEPKLPPKIQKKIKRLKKKLHLLKTTYPAMFSEVIISNFLYHTTKQIHIPANISRTRQNCHGEPNSQKRLSPQLLIFIYYLQINFEQTMPIFNAITISLMK